MFEMTIDTCLHTGRAKSICCFEHVAWWQPCSFAFDQNLFTAQHPRSALFTPASWVI